MNSYVFEAEIYIKLDNENYVENDTWGDKVNYKRPYTYNLLFVAAVN